LPAFAKRKLEKRFFMYGIGVDSGNGFVRCESGRLRVEYDQRNEPIFDEIRAAFRALETETGDRCWVPRRPITVHPGGGARVSADDDHGVVDHRGQVHRNPGLFVADGSVLPAAVGGPPALAIAAWAHHVADGIAEAV
jgi:cholesterol oxidase